MQVFTSLLPKPGSTPEQADVAVVIDVLRATSVMATALQAGAEKIVTCRDVDEARRLADQLSPRPLLCGERGCQPIDGFDLGNSPAEYVSARVAGKSLVLTTTNGTGAIEAAGDSRKLITASFLNLSAVVESLGGSGSVHLVCAGTEGEISADDVLLAGAILSACKTQHGADWSDDDSTLAFQLWRSWFPNASRLHAGSGESRTSDCSPAELSRRLRETRGGRNLVRVGFEQDLHRCAAVDSTGAVPERISRVPMTFGLQAN